MTFWTKRPPTIRRQIQFSGGSKQPVRVRVLQKKSYRVRGLAVAKRSPASATNLAEVGEGADGAGRSIATGETEVEGHAQASRESGPAQETAHPA